MQDKKTTIMTKRTGRYGDQRKTTNYEYTIVHNNRTDDVYTAAKASSIGSTDKRS